MNICRVTIIGTALFALLITGAIRVTAQAPVGDSPSNAIQISNQPRNILANQSMWFRFDYDATERPSVTIQLVNGTKSGMRFEVWTPDAIANMASNSPIGYGAAFSLACPVDAPVQGGCQTKNLIWTGAFSDSGTYNVRVINDNNIAVTALVTIEGIEIPTDTATVPSTPNVSPPAIVQNTDDPGKANGIDGKQHLLAAGTAVWYRFDYDATDRTTKTVLLVNGNHSGVRFEMWTPDRLNNWWENKPIGRGTVYMIDCSTGEDSETGECESMDLKWMGKFIFNWPVYVRVVNGNGHPTGFILTVK